MFDFLFFYGYNKYIEFLLWGVFMKSKSNLALLITSFALLIAFVGVGVGAAVINSFTITNTITFNATDVLYYVQGDVLRMSKEKYESFSSVEEIIEAAYVDTEIERATESYVGNFSGSTATAVPKSLEEWQIPNDDIYFSTSKTVLLYVFHFANYSGHDKITVKLTDPDDHTKVEFTRSADLTLDTNASGNVSDGYITLVCQATSIADSFEFENDLHFAIDKLAE